MHPALHRISNPNLQQLWQNPLETFFAYADNHRGLVRVFACLLILAIAAADFKLEEISVGFLYILPILLVSSQLSGLQVVAVAVLCSILREMFSPVRWRPGAPARISIAFAGFAMAGFFVSELNRKRRQVLENLREVEQQVRLRQAAEQQVRVLIETSPLAILTVNRAGRVMLANRSAEELLASAEEPLEGSDIRPILPILGQVLKVQLPCEFRTAMESKAQRRNGEAFLAHIWISTYVTAAGAGLAAVIWDSSENLRDREDTNLDSMLSTSRVLIGAVSHEIRNLTCAAISAHRELIKIPEVEKAEQYRVLGAILQGVDRISSSGLSMGAQEVAAVADLGTVFDEARVVIEPAIREAGGQLVWKVAVGLPLVQADQHGLLQVFLNLARNSQRAIQHTRQRQLTVEASLERDLVVVRFRDTGTGVANPTDLFKPFQSAESSSGLGLFVSRAILRAHGGDLKHEPQAQGCCFTVELWPAWDS